MPRKTAIVTMVKDECDIIELFIKINSRVADHLFVLDHDSQDGTLEILLRLKNAGYPISLFSNDSRDFQQSLLITALARQVAATKEFEWIIPLDGDEFLYCPQGRLSDVLAEAMPPNGCGQMPWSTFVPIDTGYYSSPAPLHDLFRQRAYEPTQFYKAVVTSDLVNAGAVIVEGNHQAGLNGQLLEAVDVDVTVQHVPVRGVEQIVAKALVGSHRLSIKVGRGASEGAHWDAMAQRIRQSHYQITADDLRDIAMMYAADTPSPVNLDSPRIGNADDRIEMLELSRIHLAARFDKFMEGLCRELQVARGITSAPSPGT